jgi:hypothetical protein
MNPAQVAALLAQHGKWLGPEAVKALRRFGGSALAASFLKELQSGALLEQARGLRRRPEARIEAQLDLATATATEELQEQTLPERQDQCRTWLRALRVQRIALKATENQERKVAKVRRAQVARETDAILAEIIETIATWGESPVG